MNKISIIGTAGVPACYGGFESLVENILDYKLPFLDYVVICSKKKYKKQLLFYKNAKLKYINLNANGVSSILYDYFGILNTINSDIMLILGVSGCTILPIIKLLYKGKIITNIDGLEWKRAKWNKIAKYMLKISEKMAVKYSDIIIADNKAILNYIKINYKDYFKKARLIEYGADHLVVDNSDTLLDKNYINTKYAITVCRIEPENNIHVILEAFAKIKSLNIVIVGNWENSEYGVDCREKYRDYSNIILLDPIYDNKKITSLRNNAFLYIHGHSAGGTNPSLVEAMFLGLPVLAYDCVYNRETTENKAIYWHTADELIRTLNYINDEEAKKVSKSLKEIADRRYTWKIIADKYNKIFKEIMNME